MAGALDLPLGERYTGAAFGRLPAVGAEPAELSDMSDSEPEDEAADDYGPDAVWVTPFLKFGGLFGELEEFVSPYLSET